MMMIFVFIKLKENNENRGPCVWLEAQWRSETIARRIAARRLVELESGPAKVRSSQMIRTIAVIEFAICGSQRWIQWIFSTGYNARLINALNVQSLNVQAKRCCSDSERLVGNLPSSEVRGSSYFRPYRGKVLQGSWMPSS